MSGFAMSGQATRRTSIDSLLRSALIAVLLISGSVSLVAAQEPEPTPPSAETPPAEAPAAEVPPAETPGAETPVDETTPADESGAVPAGETASDTGSQESAAEASTTEGTPETAVPAVAPERMAEIYAGDEPQTLDELVAMQDHVQEIVRRVSPAVVGVEVGPSQGTGVVVTADGYVLTAGHVIMRSKRSAIVRFRDGAPVGARTLGINRDIDSGLVKIQAEENWSYVEMGDSASLKPGQWVVTIGHPGGFQQDRGLVVRLGRVLSVGSTGIRTDCALVGGDSGGPLFDMQGRVIGINSRIGDQIVKNIHVPVNTFAETWDRLAAAQSWGNMSNLVKPAWVGLSLDAASEQVIVSAVAPGGPAELAGIQVGDRIDSFNGVDLTNPASFGEAVGRTPAFELVPVVITRDGRQLMLELETGERDR